MIVAAPIRGRSLQISFNICRQAFSEPVMPSRVCSLYDNPSSFICRRSIMMKISLIQIIKTHRIKSSHSNDPNSINNKNQNIDKIHSNTIKSLNNQFSNDDIKDSHITDTMSNQNRFENHKEKFEKAILAQLKCNTDTSISRAFGMY